jgi:hypothetical protein
MRTPWRTFAVVIVAALAGAAAAAEPAAPASPCTAALPAAIAAPAGTALAFELGAAGVQIYVCSAAAGAPGWTLQAPEATLSGPGGEAAGTHGAGPTWTATDGSAVVGAKAGAASPDATAIPWLLLRVTSHAGLGRMAEVSFIQRVATSGGLAPPTGCDAGHAGATVRVPYRATYCFHRAAPAARPPG